MCFVSWTGYIASFAGSSWLSSLWCVATYSLSHIYTVKLPFSLINFYLYYLLFNLLYCSGKCTLTRFTPSIFKLSALTIYSSYVFLVVDTYDLSLISCSPRDTTSLLILSMFRYLLCWSHILLKYLSHAPINIFPPYVPPNFKLEDLNICCDFSFRRYVL